MVVSSKKKHRQKFHVVKFFVTEYTSKKNFVKNLVKNLTNTLLIVSIIFSPKIFVKNLTKQLLIFPIVFFRQKFLTCFLKHENLFRKNLQTIYFLHCFYAEFLKVTVWKPNSHNIFQLQSLTSSCAFTFPKTCTTEQFLIMVHIQLKLL